MSENSTGQSKMTKEDWQRVEALSDEAIEAAIADDPDWQGLEVGRRESWRVVHPDGTVVVPVTVDALTLKFFEQHDLSFSGVLNAFAASQKETRD